MEPEPDEGQPIEVSVEDEPPGMERVRALSRLLDEAIEIPVINYRIGLDPILGILPVGGDSVAAAISLYIVAEGARMGASRETILKMLTNIAIDTVIGSVPVLGTVIDAVWKANERNVALLEQEFGESGYEGSEF
jgi:TctA family transporter